MSETIFSTGKESDMRIDDGIGYEFTKDKEFMQQWRKKEEEGYIYSDSNIEKVHMGWEMAKNTDSSPEVYIPVEDIYTMVANMWAKIAIDLEKLAYAEKSIVEKIKIAKAAEACFMQATIESGTSIRLSKTLSRV